jgi:RimJ/RimL family protein N-acetyltransferase/uncharacterized glyoxalase superfamily protein PhnB
MEWRPSYPITTPRLTLRPLTVEDVEDLLAYRGRPDVCRYLPFEPMDERILTTRLASDLGRRDITAEGQGLTLGVALAAGGRLVGDVVLFFTSARDAGGEIGYVFHPDVAGQGYATEACTALLDLAFGGGDGPGLHRVVARMDARNSPSVRLASRLGMRREAHHRSSEMFKGAWTDLVVYALLDHEWRAAAPERGRRAGLASVPNATMIDDGHGISLSVMLIVADAGAAVDWYRTALGATELWNLGGVAGLQVEGAPFFLHEAVPGRANERSPADAGLTTTRIEVFVDDPGRLIDRAADAGATQVEQLTPHEAPWGIHRQGGFTDPFGHRWSVGDRTPLQPFAP